MGWARKWIMGWDRNPELGRDPELEKPWEQVIGWAREWTKGWARDPELGRLWEKIMGRIPSQGMSTTHKQGIFKARKNNTLGKEHQHCSKKPPLLGFWTSTRSQPAQKSDRNPGILADFWMARDVHNPQRIKSGEIFGIKGSSKTTPLLEFKQIPNSRKMLF